MIQFSQKQAPQDGETRYSDIELFRVFKDVWKQLKFSLLHFQQLQKESTYEYYQALFESIYLTQLELSHDRADPQHRDEYTCLMIYAWYCTVKTFPERIN